MTTCVDSDLELEFVTEPDETGLGRIKVNGRYYGLPVEAVKELEMAWSEYGEWW